jgi:ABC-type transporter Mla MlaB component
MAPPLRVLLDELVPVDLATVEALARLQLERRREGSEIVLVWAPDALRDLIELVGLATVLPVEP